MTANCPVKLSVYVDGSLLFTFPDISQVNTFYELLNISWPAELGEYSEGGVVPDFVIQQPCCMPINKRS